MAEHRTVIGSRVYALVLDYENQSSLHTVPMTFHPVLSDDSLGRSLDPQGKLAGQIYRALEGSLS